MKFEGVRASDESRLAGAGMSRPRSRIPLAASLLPTDLLKELRSVGYELHIVRTEDWWDAESNPISREEWGAYAAANPLLVEEGWIEWGDIGREPSYSFTKNDGVVVGLDWRHGKVDISGPWGTVGELLTIAADLNARLVGDDGESYTLADDE